MPYKNLERRREYDRERKRKIRAEEKQKKIQEQIALGNLNFRMETKELDWSDWKQAMQEKGESPTFKEFMKVKGQIQPITEEKFEDLDSVPIDSENCEVYRKMRLGIIRRNPFFIQNHVTCKLCSAWLKIFNREYGSVVGVDLWANSKS